VPEVVGVVFKNGGKTYSFESGSLDLSRGDLVVVETVRGVEVGEVAEPPREMAEESITAPLKPVLRRVNSQDLETIAANEALRESALDTCRRLIGKHELDMKLVDAEVLFGGGKIVFSFYAEERVDFRALVVDLAKALRMRIELRQIGVRDEARILGGLGPCGRHLCCTLFQVDQEPVSIRMAKEQNLPLNPMKISGLCGRLMCCLKYEQDHYVTFRREAPRRGTPVQTERGRGVVIGYEVPKDSLTIKYEDGGIFDEPIGQCMPVDKLCCGGAGGAGGPCRGAEAASAENGSVAKQPVAAPSAVRGARAGERPAVDGVAGGAPKDVAAEPQVSGAGRKIDADTSSGPSSAGGAGGAEAGGLVQEGETAETQAAGGEGASSSDKAKSKRKRGRRRSSRSGKNKSETSADSGSGAAGTSGSAGDAKQGGSRTAKGGAAKDGRASGETGSKDTGPREGSGQGSGESGGGSAPAKKPRRRRRRPRPQSEGGGGDPGSSGTGGAGGD